MKSLHSWYIDCFIKYAEASLEKSESYKDIVPYANKLNKKANQLLIKAVSKDIDNKRLQRVLFQTGVDFIHKFTDKFSQHKVINIGQRL